MHACWRPDVQTRAHVQSRTRHRVLGAITPGREKDASPGGTAERTEAAKTPRIEPSRGSLTQASPTSSTPAFAPPPLLFPQSRVFVVRAHLGPHLFSRPDHDHHSGTIYRYDYGYL